jgi:putative ABC transport system permease protein
MNTTTVLLRIVALGMALGLLVLTGILVRISLMYLLERFMVLCGEDWRGWTADWLRRSLDRPPLRWQLGLTFPLAAGLLVLLLLQAVGLVRRVPFSYNFRNLFVRWRTTLLTALAFTLVVALMTVMLAFVNGMYRLTQGSGHPENVIVMSDGAIDEAFSNLGYRDTSEVEWHPSVLRDSASRPLASWEVYLIINQPVPESRGGARKRRFLQVRGLDDPARSGAVHSLPLHEGGAWFSDAGVQPLPPEKGGGTAIQTVLGEGIARELGKDYQRETLEVGDVFEAGPRRWVVVGILQSAGSTFDSEVWAKRQIVGPVFGKDTYTTVVLRTAGADEAREASKDLTANYKKSAVAAIVETEYYDKLNGTNQQFLVAIIFVAVVMAAGGTFGVMNTMFAAISSRTRDIGVLRILGFARWQILATFLLESLTISLIGGGLGCILGYFVNGISASTMVGSNDGIPKSVVFEMVVDANTVALGLLFTLLMGAVGGFLPALAAMRLRPLESLR